MVIRRDAQRAPPRYLHKPPEKSASCGAIAVLPGADCLVADGVATLEQEFRHVSQPEPVAQALEDSE